MEAEMRQDLKRSGDLEEYGEEGIRIAVYEDLKDSLKHLFSDILYKWSCAIDWNTLSYNYGSRQQHMGTIGNAHAWESGHLRAQDDGCILGAERTGRRLRHVSAGHTWTSGTIRTNARITTERIMMNNNTPHITHQRLRRVQALHTRLERAHQAAKCWPSTRAEDLICQIERQIRTLSRPVAVARWSPYNTSMYQIFKHDQPLRIKFHDVATAVVYLTSLESNIDRLTSHSPYTIRVVTHTWSTWCIC